ncbi:MAG: DMT family transporter, partial [Butyricicoccus sp.]|nr:DMT family transporter [Butyricicoccus sp.]
MTVRKIFLPALLCTALWGSAIPAVKSGYALFSIADGDVAAKLFFAGCRFTIAGLLVLALCVGRRTVQLVPKRDAWPGILLLSAAQTVMQYIFYYLGLGNTTGVHGSVLSATSTFFAVVVAHFAFADDRLTVRKSMGCIVGFAGVVVILAGAGLGGQGVT